MTAAAENAVLNPRDPGGWPVDWRLQVAADIHAMNNRSDRAAALRAAAALVPDDPPSAAVVARAFARKVAAKPRAVNASDVEALRNAGVSDADIVRLCELVAFVSYQARVEAGVALLECES